MTNESVYAFRDYDQWRNDLAMRIERPRGGARRGRSLQTWADVFGYRSPRSVAMILKGQRLPSQRMLHALSSELRLSPQEHRYVEVLVAIERARRLRRCTRALTGELAALAPKDHNDVTSVDPDLFSYISDWYHVVIKQLLSFRWGQMDEQVIHRRLGGRLSLRQIRVSLKKMHKLGLISWNAATLRYEVVVPSLRTASTLPSRAIRQHHHQMLERAREALESQPLEAREFAGITLRFDRRRVREAKDAIRRFRDQFNDEFADPDGCDVYQLNLQFFSHTDDMKEARP